MQFKIYILNIKKNSQIILKIFNQDPKGEIISLSKFYEVDLIDEQIEHVVKVTSFDSMKKNTEVLGKNQPIVMFRKGQNLTIIKLSPFLLYRILFAIKK